MKALIFNTLCFGKTEINRFGPISGGVFLTQGFNNYTLQLVNEQTLKIKKSRNNFTSWVVFNLKI